MKLDLPKQKSKPQDKDIPVPWEEIDSNDLNIAVKAAFWGETGAGKTKSALELAEALDTTIAIIETEFKRSTHYAHQHSFKTLQLNKDYSPQTVLQAFNYLVEKGYGTILIDSLTDVWNGSRGGCEQMQKELVESGNKRYKDGRLAWAAVKKPWGAMLDGFFLTDVNVIVTATEKAPDPKDGSVKPACEKKTIKEFDLIFHMDKGTGHLLKATSLPEFQGKAVKHPSREYFAELLAAKAALKGENA